MKPNIHPTYYTNAKVTCSSCGNTFTTGSTKQSIVVEVCYKCHPFYTGEHRFLDIKGRVDLFQKKQETAKKYQLTHADKKMKKKKRDTDYQPKSLKELLGEV